MALIVETGAGLADAESYASIADAEVYLAKRAKTDAWDLIDDKEAALRLATDFLTQRFRGRWGGVQVTSAQALDWPRYDVMWPDYRLGTRSHTSIPVELRNATIEMALRTASGPLTADVGRATKREKVDVIEVEYEEGGSQQTDYAAVDAMVRPLLSSGGGFGSIPVLRA